MDFETHIMGKSKKVRDPLAPKVPLNSFLEFSREERPKIIQEQGRLPLKEISKEISTRWKNLDEFSKQKYEKRVQENRNKYLMEIEEFRKRQEKNADQVENVNCEPTANGDSMPASTPDEVPAVVEDVAETEGNSISTEPMMVQLSQAKKFFLAPRYEDW